MSLRIGILSFAHGHVGMYCGEIAKMDDAAVVAGWDDNPARGKEACEKHGAEFVADLDALLARDDLDAFIVGSETSRHAGHVAAAARRGKPILLQKPMALTLEDCDRIGEAVAKHNARFSLAWQMRCDPQNQWMRKSVREGLVGKPLMVRRRHGLSTQAWGKWFEDSWHVKPELNRGMFMDDASHAVDWFVWMFGKPKSVFAEIDTLLNPKIPDDNGVAVFRWHDGPIGIVESSFTCLAADETVLIVGSEGSIVQRWGDGTSCTPDPTPHNRGLRFKRAGEKDWTVVGIATPPAHGERIKDVARPGVEFLLGQREPIATAADGRAVTEALLAAHRSAAEGRRIEL
ncbi:MAG: Gfo/Idh/MocA family oxidoreductase [Planctomycetota bacterium]|nr:Gfo/Idh/MocA family oxidoreductase [Planctomycetota bacterium]